MTEEKYCANGKTELKEDELTAVAGGRAPRPIRSWEVAAKYLYENNRYLWLPEFLQEQYLYYLESGEWDLIGDLIKNNLIQYGKDYPMLQEAFNASVVGYI